MFKNLSIGSKLTVNLALPIIGLLVVGIFAYTSFNKITSEAIQVLHDEAHKAISLVLNADRDFYQALTAMQEIVYTNNPSNELIDDYTSNLSQVQDRTSTAVSILDKARSRWTIYKDDSGRSIFDIYSGFTNHINNWKTTSDSILEAVKNNQSISSSTLKKWQEEFDTAREDLNVIGELIDKGAMGWTDIETKYARSQAITLIIIFAISLAITLGLGLLITRGLKDSISRLLEVVTNVSQGDLSIKEIDIVSNDELGRLGKAINMMTQNLRTIISNVVKAAGSVTSLAGEIDTSIDQSSKAIQQVATTIQGVADGAQETAKSISDISTSVEDMSNRIERLSQSASNVEKATQEAEKLSEEGKEVVDELNRGFSKITEATDSIATVMNKLESAAGEIGNIVESIMSISSQTNLLALNAAIEAARAGEAGRGFAVVADEVRKLAEESNQSAQGIAQFIDDIRSRITLAAQTTNEAGKTISSQVEMGGRVTETFNNIAQINSQIMKMIQDINSGIISLVEHGRKISDAIQNVAAISQENAASSEEVSAATEEMTASIEEMAQNLEKLVKISEELDGIAKKFII